MTFQKRPRWLYLFYNLPPPPRMITLYENDLRIAQYNRKRQYYTTVIGLTKPWVSITISQNGSKDETNPFPCQSLWPNVLPPDLVIRYILTCSKPQSHAGRHTEQWGVEWPLGRVRNARQVTAGVYKSLNLSTLPISWYMYRTQTRRQGFFVDPLRTHIFN